MNERMRRVARVVAWVRARNSVRMRLTLWNVGALALILGALGVAIRYTATTNLMATVDGELADRTQRVFFGGHPGEPSLGERLTRGDPGPFSMPPWMHPAPPDKKPPRPAPAASDRPDSTQNDSPPTLQGGSRPSQDGPPISQDGPPPATHSEGFPGGARAGGREPGRGPERGGLPRREEPTDAAHQAAHQNGGDRPPRQDRGGHAPHSEGDARPPHSDDGRPPEGEPGQDGGHGGGRLEGRDFRGRWPRIFDRAGVSWPMGDKTALWDARGFALALGGRAAWTTTEVNGEPTRVYSQPALYNGAVAGVVQAAHPLGDVERAVSGLTRTLLALAPFALLIAGAGGAFSTERALRPVRRISQMAGRIGVNDLSQRLPVTGSDEFSALASTFNAMLRRLEAAFEQREHLVERLQEAVEQQRRFTGDASHELRTPLTIIKANTSLTLRGRSGETEMRECIEEVDRAADTMTRLVQDLLLLTRSDGGHLGRNREPLAVREMLADAVKRVRPFALATIRLEPAGTEPAGMESGTELRVEANGEEMGRVFTNLLENAARHTPAGGEIVVSARQVGASVVATVADTGSGIAPEHLPHLCERFYRVDSARSRPDGGTGLGLAICKSIVEAHGGSLAFESAVGAGTTVHVTLPLRKP